RTLFDSGTSTLQIRNSMAVLVTATSVHVIDPGGGLDRWYWAPSGCKVTGAVSGDLGVLTGLSCGATHRLVLRKPYEDGQVWEIESAALPVAADQTLLAWDGVGRTLVQLSRDKGVPIASLVLTLPAQPAPIATTHGSMQLLFGNGVLTAVETA